MFIINFSFINVSEFASNRSIRAYTIRYYENTYFTFVILLGWTDFGDIIITHIQLWSCIRYVDK